jgi:uncharacterized membrane protein YhaH (DUF805 family)
MKNIENKKNSVAIILISTTGMMISYLIKDIYYDDGSTYALELDVNYPLVYYKIYIFGYLLEYTKLLSVLLLSLSIGVYCLLFKTDEEIKKSLNNLKILKLPISKKSKSELKEIYSRISNKIEFAFKKFTTYIKNFYLLGKSAKIERIEKSETQQSTKLQQNFLKRLFSYDGRIDRTEFFVKIALISLIFSSIIKTTVTSDAQFYNDYETVLLLVLLNILWLILEIKPIIKRLHDLNLPGWVSLLPIIPKQLLLFAIILKNSISIDYAAGIIIIFMWTVPFFMLLLTLIPGSKSQNKYGN